MSDTATDAPVLTERRDNVLLITLNRPDRATRSTARSPTGVAAALDELDGDDGLRVGVLTGAGKGFCAGMDLKAFAAGERPWRRRARLRRDRPASRRASRSSPRSRASPSPAASRSRWPAT